MELNFINLVGHLAFFLSALSFWLRDMLLLRLVAVISSLVGIYYNYAVAHGPLWLPIFWLSIFTLINGGRIVHLIWERRQVDLSAEEAEIHATQFSAMTPVEFLKLTRVGVWRNYEPGDILTKHGEPLKNLLLIYNGEVKVSRDGEQIATCRDGSLIGEVSFLRQGVASADVYATVPTKCLSWASSDLRALLQRNPSMHIVMQSVFSADLTKKLMPT